MNDDGTHKMNAEELAFKFRSKIAAAAVEKEKQADIAGENSNKRAERPRVSRMSMRRMWNPIFRIPLKSAPPIAFQKMRRCGRAKPDQRAICNIDQA